MNNTELPHFTEKSRYIFDSKKPNFKYFEKKYSPEQIKEVLLQIEAERDQEIQFTLLAAKKIEEKTGIGFIRDAGYWNSNQLTDQPKSYSLWTQLSQYDNWEGYIDALKKGGIKVEEWSYKYDDPVRAEFDVTDDPDFAESHQKVFPIFINYYDSHFGGY